MPKQDKPKTTKGVQNDNRRNKKAWKSKPSVHHIKSPQSEVQKIIMNGGMYVNVARRWAQNA